MAALGMTASSLYVIKAYSEIFGKQVVPLDGYADSQDGDRGMRAWTPIERPVTCGRHETARPEFEKRALSARFR